jgi:hypothetical protein
MAEQAIYDMLADYAYQLKLGIKPHESTQGHSLNSHTKGGFALDQIQLPLGHGSIKTTTSTQAFSQT